MDLSRSHVAIICGKRGGGKCLHEDTLITLDDGREIKIKELEKNKNKVLSINKNLNIISNKKDEFFKRNVKSMLNVKLRSGKELKLTKEHPLFTINGWEPINKLKKGSRIATPRIINNFGNKKITLEEIKLIAYLLSEGNLSNNLVLFNNTDKKIIDDFKKSIKKFDKNLLIKKHSDFDFRVIKSKKSKEKSSIRKYLDKIKIYGKLAHEKEIPSQIFQLSKKDLSLFLNRMFSCNGCICYDINKKAWSINYSTSSKKMSFQIQSLLLKFGILSKIRTKKIKKRLNYEIVILKQDNYKYIKEINFFGNKKEKSKNIKIKKNNNLNIDTIPKELWNTYKIKNFTKIGKQFGYKVPKSFRTCVNYSPSRQELNKIADIEKNKNLKNLANSDIFWDEIINIKEIKGNFTVYDITVPETHNFIANNIIVHNSYTMSVIMEEFAKQPFEIKERLSAIIIDTVGIFWTMKYENKELPQDLLDKWDLKAKGIEIRNMIPFGKKNFYEKKEIPFDQPFSIKTSQVDLEDWLALFRLTWKDQESSLLSRSIEEIRKKVGNLYDIDDIITISQKDTETTKETKDSLIGRLKVAKSWGLFSKQGTSMKDFARAGTITTIDVSTYKQAIGMESIQELIVGLLGKRLYEERMLYRKEEEKNLLIGKKKESEMPIVWMMIDEAHMFMPQDRPSMALDVLLQWIRVGRQPGLSLLLATQRPNKLHSEAISQCDFFLSMRMTAQEDIQAVSAIRPSYLKIPMDKYYAQMPKTQGFAILVDDNSEKVMMLKIRPRITWDGGKTANVFSD
ncbi:MAG: LAGLIDADG family homing endonuclease [Candidatus ainarchaeum sp.]|nr:LAGLIDADG family homing endonuclease [Candidatus ainarchaeum sp.]